MKHILYVSDLDGTLLNSEAKLSPTTCDILNRLIEKGMPFTYATARSLNTARQVTADVRFKLPVIVHNGVFIKDINDGQIILMNSFDASIKELISALIASDLYPIVYSVIEGREMFSFIEDKCSQAQLQFLTTRINDERYHPVKTVDELMMGEIYYLTLINDYHRLQPFQQAYDSCYRCLLTQDVYTPEWWLEIMPQGVSKAQALKQLKAMLGYDYVVVFGDGINDLDLFDVADEGYAVANAHEQLKQRAQAVIGNHDDDGVAHALEALYEQ